MTEHESLGTARSRRHCTAVELNLPSMGFPGTIPAVMFRIHPIYETPVAQRRSSTRTAKEGFCMDSASINSCHGHMDYRVPGRAGC